MNIRVVNRLTWRRSGFLIATVIGTLLVLASSAMAANLGLWHPRPVFGGGGGFVVEPIEYVPRSVPALQVEGTVTTQRRASGAFDLRDGVETDGRAPDTTVPDETAGSGSDGSARTESSSTDDGNVQPDDLLKDNTIQKSRSEGGSDGPDDRRGAIEDDSSNGRDSDRERGRGAGGERSNGRGNGGDGRWDDD
jgi:hypothetical protein